MLSIRLLSDNYRHGYLLAALLLLIVARPFVAQDGGSFGLIDTFLLLTLLTAVLTSARGLASRWLALSLAGLVVTSRLWAVGGGASRGATLLFEASLAAFAGLSAVLLLVHIFRPQTRVTSDAILGAVNAYLLIGIAWAAAFSILEAGAPGSFDLGGRVVDDARTRVWTFLGFSFTTLTTLGYGNISPQSPRADALANAEAMLGQFYVAVLVGRLVALQLAQQGPGRSAGPDGPASSASPPSAPEPGAR
ncbi:MAG: ion channel [Planctomycetota bacterium]